ncbi:hypothetical protein BGZ65_009795 [Modicella reniformis]|uniref:Uncharacterized protein n=1 Tax=Modicella reniformis TaxID=1440133 RepID=A0A9P6JG44_9FUNG|nr:hypothetical protein BGZ65_009795 [Modicella reniformis]
MPLISVIPHPPTLIFYRTALRAIRPTPPLTHLRRKLQYNIRDGILIHQHERNYETVQDLIRGGEQDLAMILTWKHVDPLWLERIFKKPTANKS